MKRKRFAALLPALCLVFALGGTASAASLTETPYITDTVGLITQEEAQELETQAERIAMTYGCAPYILVVENFRDYEREGNILDAGMDLYERWDLGCGEEKNGILLMLSMAERDYALVPYGSLTQAAFTDYGQAYLEDRFLDDFRDDDWIGGFRDYLDTSAWLLEQAQNGVAYDTNTVYGAGTAHRGFQPLVIIVPLAVALVVCLVFTAQMKTARKQTQARNYITGNGVNMRIVQDSFTHRTVTRQVIQQKSSGGGGGGTTVNSRGFSGRSGKF